MLKQYEEMVAELHANGKEPDPEDEKPVICKFFIPANCSATTAYQRLAGNGGIGLMFETEGDTLANMLKTDYGNYSDGFRKVFHHESISYARRKDDESVEVPRPKLSVLLSGTPQQIQTLIPNTENGLFSRFMFYTLNMPLEWEDVFDETDEDPLDDTYQAIGEELYNTYQILRDNKDIRFRLTKEQGKHFNAFFRQIQDEYANLFGNDIVASIRRLGLITFRIAMVLNALRLTERFPADERREQACLGYAEQGKRSVENQDGDISPDRYCSDADYHTAHTILQTLLKHMAHIYQDMPENEVTAGQQETNHSRQALYNALPQTFTRQDYLATAATLNIKPKNAEKYITYLRYNGRINKPGHNQYEKVEKKKE